MPEINKESSTPIEGHVTAILEGAKFDGKLTFEGTVQIVWRIHGRDFHKDTLVINEGSFVQAPS